MEQKILALRQLAREWRQNRLDTTAVVNEAYFKLFRQRDVDWQNRGHAALGRFIGRFFFAIAAQLMRRILVDHARRSLRQRHGGHAIHLGLTEADHAQSERGQPTIFFRTRIA